MSSWHWLRARFSFQGRASLKEYWLQFLFAPLLAFAIAVSVIFVVKTAGATILILADFVFLIWGLLAVVFRRCHDHDQPFFDRRRGFAFFYDRNFKRGTIGPNKYGPDPLEKVTTSA